MTEKTNLALYTHVQSKNVALLRHYFKNLNDPDYVFDENTLQTKISISGEYSRKQAKFPFILFGQITSSGLMNRTIGQEMYQPIYENGNKVGYRLSGNFFVNAVISIGCESTAEARKLVDYVTSLYRINGKQWLLKNGMTLTDLSLVSPKTELIGNDLVYWERLNVSFITSWTQEVKDIGLIQEIDVDFDVK